MSNSIEHSLERVIQKKRLKELNHMDTTKEKMQLVEACFEQLEEYERLNNIDSRAEHIFYQKQLEQHDIFYYKKTFEEALEDLASDFIEGYEVFSNLVFDLSMALRNEASDEQYEYVYNEKIPYASMNMKSDALVEKDYDTLFKSAFDNFEDVKIRLNDAIATNNKRKYLTVSALLLFADEHMRNLYHLVKKSP